MRVSVWRCRLANSVSFAARVASSAAFWSSKASRRSAAGGLDFRVACGLAGAKGLAELGDLGQHLGARFGGRGGGQIKRFFDSDQRVVDPLLCLVGWKLQPPAGAWAAVLEGLDVGSLKRAVTCLQPIRQEIRDPGAAKSEGGGKRPDPEAVAAALGFAALAELIEAVLQVGRGLIGHGQLLT